MTWLFRNFIRPALFANDSEKIHDQTLKILNRASENELFRDFFNSFFQSAELPQQQFGLRFPNPVGLAAGMDKKAEAMPIWESLGFGFCELGGVTWHGQPGNDPPRMFRIVEDQALINRMGFNNPGAKIIAKNLNNWKNHCDWPSHPVGINLGKSQITFPAGKPSFVKSPDY